MTHSPSLGGGDARARAAAEGEEEVRTSKTVEQKIDTRQQEKELRIAVLALHTDMIIAANFTTSRPPPPRPLTNISNFRLHFSGFAF